jgi:chorismate mutase
MAHERVEDTEQAPREPQEPRDREDVVQRIGALRDEIDRLDEELVRLLSARAGCALEIGRLKTTLGMEVYQPSREEAVKQHVRSLNQGPLDDDAIARLFERIIDEARRLERVMQERSGQHAGPQHSGSPGSGQHDPGTQD